MTLRDLLTTLGIEYKEHGESSLVTRGWIGVECPWCGRGTGRPGLGINVTSLRSKCWKCGSHSLLASLCEISSQPRERVAALLAAVDDAVGLLAGDETPTGRYKEPDGVGPLQTVHRNYLSRRGFDPDEVVETWAVKGIGRGGRYQWRLFLPVFVEQKPVSWTTRAVGNVELRYVSAPKTDESVHLKDTLFGEDKAGNSVVVVEGPFDAMRIGPGAVATYGLSVTLKQRARLARYARRTICFDNDPEAQRVARRLADELSVFDGATYVAVLSGKDPCESPEEEIHELRERFLDD